VTLVEAGKAAEVGGGLVRGDGTFVISRNCGGVIAESSDGSFSHIEFLRNDFGLG